MYNNPLFPYGSGYGQHLPNFGDHSPSRVDPMMKQKIPMSSPSTAANTGGNGASPVTNSVMLSERDVAAAREVLRSVIASSGSRTPRGSSSLTVESGASVPPVPRASFQSKAVQTDVSSSSSTDGMLRAAGMSLLHFAEELKSTQRHMDKKSDSILHEIKLLKKHVIGVQNEVTNNR
jgi:hypothetical protein